MTESIVRKSLHVGPRLVASTAILLMLSTVLTAPLAGVAVLCSGAALVALASGMAEVPAVRALFKARELSMDERESIAPVLARLCAHGLGPPVLRIVIAKSDAADVLARPVGRRTVVLSSDFCAGIDSSGLSIDEALASLGCAALVCRAGLSRSDVAIAFWLLLLNLLSRALRPMRFVARRWWALRWPIAIAVTLHAWAEATGTFERVLGFAMIPVVLIVMTVNHRSGAWARYVDRVVGQDLRALVRSPGVATCRPRLVEAGSASRG